MFYYNMLLFKLVDPQFCWMVCRGSWEAPVVPVALQGWGCRASRAFAKIIKKWCKTWHIDAHISYIDLQYIGFIGALELVVNTWSLNGLLWLCLYASQCHAATRIPAWLVKLEPSARQPVWILDEAAGVELFFSRGTPWKTGCLGMNRSA
jgi:hypothetical protein